MTHHGRSRRPPKGAFTLKRLLVRALGRETSPLGYGCAALTAAGSRRDAIRVLEAAFDAGIRHFDVARLYGQGVAEEILGEFLAGKRAEVTITSKFGLEPAPVVARVPFLPTVKRLLKLIPAIDRRVRRTVSSMTAAGSFDVESARRSLETSLRMLRTDYLDCWLLHEADADEANRPELVEFLLERQRAGQVRAFGLGSAFQRLGGDCSRFPGCFQVFQFENSVLGRERRRLGGVLGRALITHSALAPMPRALEHLGRSPGAVSRFNGEHGFDLRSPRDVAALMLAWAVRDNPEGVVLFGSGSPHHVRENVALLDDPRVTPAALWGFEALFTPEAEPNRSSPASP